MAEIGSQSLIPFDNAGPLVKIALGIDCHLEPETEKQIDLGLAEFSGWNRVDQKTLTNSLLKVAELEAKERFGGQGCYDPIYLEGLTQYVHSLNQATPLEPLIIESVLRHGIHPQSEAPLRIGVAKLYANGSEEVCKFISEYLVRGRSAAGEELPANLHVSAELAEALAATIGNLNAHSQTRLIKIFSDSELQDNPAVVEAVINLVNKTSEQKVREQAVLFLKDLPEARVDEVMQACWKAGQGNSRAEGIAIAALLKSHPEELALRNELEKRLRRDNSGGSDFVSALFESHVPAAVALALDQLDRNWAIDHAPFKPLASMVLAYQNIFAPDQTGRDLNRIAYHLKSSFSGHAKMAVSESLETLLASGRESAQKFVVHQLASPPNETRRTLVEEALRGS